MPKKKRHLFEELKQGLQEIQNYKNGKITLRTHTFRKKEPPQVDASIIRKTREKLNMSRGVFALRLRVSPRTLEKWEQGETIPNHQAAALILMLRKFPDTLERLAEV